MFILLSLACVSATDDNQTDTVAQDNDDVILTEDNVEPNDFTALNNAISQCTENEVNLTTDYAYNYDSDHSQIGQDGIMIRKDNTIINGQGHTIDAKGYSKVFGVIASNVTFKNIKFINGHNYGEYGGGVIHSLKTGLIDNCTFTNSSADKIGGAVYYEGNVVVKNCVFKGNKAEKGGAFVTENDITLIMENCTFEDNSATDIGGALYCMNSVIDSTINGKFNHNLAKEDGGAIYFSGALTNVNITGKFTNHQVTDEGGAIYFNERLTNVVINGNFTSNSASLYGGANCFKEVLTNVNITGNFNDNHAYGANDYLGGGANQFRSKLINVNIIGNFTNNTATTNGGANNFFREIGPVNIIGNFTNNTAIGFSSYYGYGGANYFHEIVTHFTLNGNFTDNRAGRFDGGANFFERKIDTAMITGNFNSNTANRYGGANCFETLSNVNITGNFNGNHANKNSDGYGGGANQFMSTLNNVHIIGNFTNNTANANGGVNYFVGEINTITITGNFKGNMAGNNAGSNYFCGSVKNLNLTANFTSNRAGTHGAGNVFLNKLENSILIANFENNTISINGSAYHFATDIENVTMKGNFINNTGKSVIYIRGSVTNSTIHDSIFANDRNIIDARGLIVKDSWFGNNATDYSTMPNVGTASLMSWLFLNATYTLDTYLQVADITFNLFAYDSGNISAYDSSLLHPFNLTLSSNGKTDRNVTVLNESVRYAPYNAGTCSVTASFKNLNGTLVFEIEKVNPEFSVIVCPEIINYGENMTVILSYRDTATGKINITLKGKNYNKTFNNLDLNSTILLPEGITPDEYNVTVTYSGNGLFNNATANATLTVKKIKTYIVAKSVIGIYRDWNSLEATLINCYNKTLESVELTVDLNGVKTYKTRYDGKIIVYLYDFAANNYTARINFAGNETYEGSSASVNITINKRQTELKAENITAIYNASEDLVIILNEINGPIIANTDVIVDLNGAKTYTTDENGTIRISTAGLGAKTYDVYIAFEGNQNYTQSNATARITVNKDATQLTAKNVTTVYNINKEFAVTLKDSQGNPISGVQVTVDLNDAKTYTTDENGTIKVPIKDMAANNYTAKITFEGNENYTESNTTAKVTITKAETQLSSTNITAAYNSGNYLVVILTDDQGNPVSGAQITIDLNGAKTYTTDENGTIRVPTIGVAVNAYSVNVTFEGNENYTQSNTTAKVTITQATTQLTAANVTGTYNSGDYLVVILTDGYGNPVRGAQITIDMNGAKTYTTNENGTIRVPTKGMTANNYTAKITFEGNQNYTESNTTAKVTITKAATKLVAKDVKTTYNINKYLTITLKDGNGNPISGAKITVKLKGAKNYITNKKGQIKINVAKLIPKTYTAKITFAGDSNHIKSTKNVKVTVKKAKAKITAKKKTFKRTKKVKKYKITLKAGKKRIKKVKVTLKIKKKTYKAKTNSKGKATFKIKKLSKKGKYAAKIKFKGNKYYKKATKKVKIKIK